MVGGRSGGTITEVIRMVEGLSPDMARKVKTSISIRPELKNLAEKYGINLSALLEDALIQRLRDLVLIEQGKGSMLRPGFEPGSRDRESRMIGRATPPELGI